MRTSGTYRPPYLPYGGLGGGPAATSRPPQGLPHLVRVLALRALDPAGDIDPVRAHSAHRLFDVLRREAPAEEGRHADGPRGLRGRGPVVGLPHAPALA